MEPRRRRLGRRCGEVLPVVRAVAVAAPLLALVHAGAAGAGHLLQFVRLPAAGTSRSLARSARSAMSGGGTKPAFEVNEDEYIEVWDQTTQELALDVRELLITDGNLFFIGPELESYGDNIEEVANLLNYTFNRFEHNEFGDCAYLTATVEQVFTVPPLLAVQRWPWSVMRHGLIIWIDPDGNTKWDAYENDRIRKLKFPVKKNIFGPDTPANFLEPNVHQPADPIDMWQEADVHVDLRDLEKAKGSVTNLILASTINAILASPAKWRGWFKAAKTRGTIPADFQTPLETRRAFYSHGVSPRLNRLLNA